MKNIQYTLHQKNDVHIIVVLIDFFHLTRMLYTPSGYFNINNVVVPIQHVCVSCEHIRRSNVIYYGIFELQFFVAVFHLSRFM